MPKKKHPMVGDAQHYDCPYCYCDGDMEGKEYGPIKERIMTVRIHWFCTHCAESWTQEITYSLTPIKNEVGF